MSYLTPAVINFQRILKKIKLMPQLRYPKWNHLMKGIGNQIQHRCALLRTSGASLHFLKIFFLNKSECVVVQN